MPELPDVEVFRSVVSGEALGRTVETVSVPGPALLADVSERTLRDRLKGASLTGTRRHGKHLFCAVEGDGWLRLHFGMTGRPAVCRQGDEPGHTRLRLDFDDGGCLAVVSLRKLGEIGLTGDWRSFIREKGLGPDCLDLDLDGFRRRLRGRRGTVKGTLLDQSVLAGLGSVYADEALFQAGVHPRAGTGSLGRRRTADLWSCIGSVLDRAVQAGAQPGRMPDDWLLPRRREGEACPRCGGIVQRTRVSGRSTYFCPGHQEGEA